MDAACSKRIHGKCKEVSDVCHLFDTPPVDRLVRRATTGVSLRMAYGYQVKDGHDPVLNLVDRAINAFIVASIPGSFLVDNFPIRELSTSVQLKPKP